MQTNLLDGGNLWKSIVKRSRFETGDTCCVVAFERSRTRSQADDLIDFRINDKLNNSSCRTFWVFVFFFFLISSFEFVFDWFSRRLYRYVHKNSLFFFVKQSKINSDESFLVYLWNSVCVHVCSSSVRDRCCWHLTLDRMVVCRAANCLLF